MYTEFSVPIEEVVDLLQLERDPKSIPGADSFNVRCPLCGDKKYHLNINTRCGLYRCLRCSGDEKNLGVLDLYGRVRLGTPLIPGVNSSEIYAKLKEELSGSSIPRASVKKQKKTYSDIIPAADPDLDKVYNALLDLPYLHLSDGHKQNLIKRGLDEEDIEKNKYKTFPEAKDWIYSHPDYRKAKKLFDEKGIKQEQEKYSKISYLPKETMIGYMLIGNDILKQNIKLKGVPGAFKLNSTWFFKADVGIMIPTRNYNKQIVGMQIRKDKAVDQSKRYMTVSSKGLPEGVTTKISRIHFPLANEQAKKGTVVYFTEGPLKADVALKLLDKPAMFIAIPGVNNTKEIPEVARYLKENGINTVKNCLDMDKLTNVYVAKASKDIRKIFQKYDIRFNPYLWDDEYAHKRIAFLKKLCKEQNIEWLERSRLSVNIYVNIKHLEECKIDISSITDQYGNPLNKWNPDTKGIDDFLLSSQKKKLKNAI